MASLGNDSWPTTLAVAKSSSSSAEREELKPGFVGNAVPLAFCTTMRSPRSIPRNKTAELEDAVSPVFGANVFPTLSEEMSSPQRDIDVARLERDVSMERMLDDELGDGMSSSSSSFDEPGPLLVSRTLSALEGLGASMRDAVKSTKEYMLETVDARNIDNNVPKYPIVRYLVLGAEQEQPAPSQTQSYEDALALSVFVSEFVAMLQAGFRVIKHMPQQPARLYSMVLSPDCAILSWTPARARPGDRKLATKRRISDAAVIAEPARVNHAKAANCFALTFAPLSERQAGLAPRETHVFEPANLDTKHLLVDGFQLLVERAVHHFFASQEFRVARVVASKRKLQAKSKTSTASAPAVFSQGTASTASPAPAPTAFSHGLRLPSAPPSAPAPAPTAFSHGLRLPSAPPSAPAPAVFSHGLPSTAS